MRYLKNLEKAYRFSTALPLQLRSQHSKSTLPHRKMSTHKTDNNRPILSAQTTRELHDGMQVIERLVDKSAKEVIKEQLGIFAKDIKDALNSLDTKVNNLDAKVNSLDSKVNGLEANTAAQMNNLKNTLEKNFITSQANNAAQIADLKIEFHKNREDNAKFHAEMHSLVSNIYRSQTNRTNAFVGLAVASAGLYLGLKEYGFFHASHNSSKNFAPTATDNSNVSPKA